MYEVMEGSVRLTLNDAEAIAGAKRVEREVKRTINRLDREEAEIRITGNIKDLKKSLKEAEALHEKHAAKLEELDEKRSSTYDTLDKKGKAALTREINQTKKLVEIAKERADSERKVLDHVQDQYEQFKRTNRESDVGLKKAKEREKLEDELLAIYRRQEEAIRRRGKEEASAHRMNAQYDAQRQADIQREGQLRARAAKLMEGEFDRRAARQRAENREHQRALDMDRDRPVLIAKLQQEYDEAFDKADRLEKSRKRLFSGKFREASSPEVKQRVEIEQARAVAEMEALRMKLKALGADPIRVNTSLEGGDILAKLAGVGEIGMRLGPFAGTLSQFAKAGLMLGPILTGLVGTVGALAGAIGTGLTGALGVAGAGALGFGATMGGVFLALKPISTQFKEINKASNAYHQQAHKTGAESEKAKKKLAEFNHVTRDLSPHARKAFLDLGNLNSRWKELTKESRVSGMEGMAEGVQTLSDLMPTLGRNTNDATKKLSKGFTEWMKGLRSSEGLGIINTIMNNTNAAIEPLMRSLGHLGAALGRVTASFSKHFRPLLSDFEHWTGSLDRATENTTKLDGGVTNLVDSFRDVLGVTMAFGRVVKEVAAAAMGPGGGLMDDMAGSLNRLAESIHDNPQGLKDFFGDSIETTKALYDTLVPLVKLFLEFSTILRPATTALLGAIGPVASAFAKIADALGPLFTVGATLWLFKRGTATAVGALAGATNALAAAMTRLGKAKAGAAISNFAGGLGKTTTAATAATAATTTAATATGARRGPAVVTMGGRQTTGNVVGGAANAAKMEAQTVGRMARLGGAMSALSYGLLGVSATTAALGAVVVAAGIGIKKTVDDINSTNKREQHIQDVTGVDPRQKRGGPLGPVRDFLFGDTGPDARRLEKVGKDLIWINDLRVKSGEIQRQLLTTHTALANASLNVESAEKAYADAVKTTGKNSLEARMALQSLREAKAAEVAASKAWSQQTQSASAKVQRSLLAAKEAWERGKGKPGQDKLKEQLLKSRDAVTAFNLNIGRAKQGLEIFTGTASERIGRFARQWDSIKNVKNLLIQVQDQAAAEKLTGLVGKLKDLGHGGAARKILIDAKTPEEAIRRLEARLKAVERARKVKVGAETGQARSDLDSVLDKMGAIDRGKPTAHPHVAKEKPLQDLADITDELGNLDGAEADATVNVKMNLEELSSTPTHGPTPLGDGWGYKPGAIKQAATGMVRGYAAKNKKSLANQLLGSNLGSMDAHGSGLNAFNGIATRFGLTVGSGFRPGSITSSGNLSYHAMGRARDFPGSASNMMAFAKFMASAFGSRLKELIYTPLGWSIKNGQRVAPYAQADHYDHVHVAMATGGKVDPGRYTTPQVLFAEERGHPEYFISTNPRDRARSQHLIAQAAAEVGMPQAMTFAKGGRLSMGDMANFARRAGLKGAALVKALAIAMAESKGDPHANLVTSKEDSRGLTQINTKAWKGWAKHDLYDPVVAFRALNSISKGGKDFTPWTTYTKGTFKQFMDSARKAAIATRGGGGKDSPAKAVEKAVTGAATNIANVLAGRQAVLARAERSSDPMSVFNAIMGKGGNQSIPMAARADRRRRAAALTSGGISAAAGEESNRLTRGLPTPGLMEALLTQDRVKGRRLQKIDKALAPGRKLKPSTRQRLLEERAGLISERSENRTQRVELRKKAQEAKFEADQKGNAKVNVDYNNALAESTKTLDDDLAAARAEQAYYAARYQWALKNKDAPGATEALTSYNAATGKITSLTDQIANDKKQAGIDFLAANQAYAELTPQMDDDLAVATMTRDFYQQQLDLAIAAGDMPGIAAAAGPLKQANDSIKSINDTMAQLPFQQAAANAALTTDLNDDVGAAQMAVDYWQGIYDTTTGADQVAAAQSLAGARGTLKDAARNAELLPLERDKAMAALTSDLSDDERAAKALRNYWQTQLDNAKASGDVSGQIEAANNVASLNNDISQMQQTQMQQMVTYANALRDVYKSYASNTFTALPGIVAQVGQSIAQNMQTNPSGAPVSAQSPTVINNFGAPPPDPHTWAKGVEFELGAMV